MLRDNGIGLQSSWKRKIRSGREFNRLFPNADTKDVILKNDGTVHETVGYIKKIVAQSLDDTKKIAPLLKGINVQDTCNKIWDFVYWHIQYKLDKPGIEELRRPRRLWQDRKTGGDCDCYSIFISSVLSNLGIAHYFRVTKYEADWQHIYVVAQDQKKKILLLIVFLMNLITKKDIKTNSIQLWMV